MAVVPPVFGQPYGLDSRPSIGPFLNQTLPEEAPTVNGGWSAVPAFPNITFIHPLGLTYLPGTSDLVVWELEGKVWSFQKNPAVASKTLVLDISNQCQGWNDCGLLSLAFHPGFATNRYLFVWYNWVPPGTVVGGPEDSPDYRDHPTRNRLSRFTVDENGIADPASETVFIDQNRQHLIHNGGGMFFHPDTGFLHVTLGDDDGEHSQSITESLFCGMLRIDVDQRGGDISHPIPRPPINGVTANYYIPNDNPFVGQADALEEFFAVGLRSPHRMTIDPVTRRIYIGDVGNDSREEVDINEPGETGLNFQWPDLEGDEGDLEPPYLGISKRPVLDYSHGDGVGTCVIGGYVYRGSEFAAELGGKYIFGDNISRYIWMMNEESVPATKTLLAVLPRGPGPIVGFDFTGLSSFGVDQDGELYLCQLSTEGGRIYKLQRGATSGRDLPPLLSQTTAFYDVSLLQPNPSLIPYDVASPLWSDGALKKRWMAIPSGTRIGFSSTGEWTFPEGTVFVKHFELPVDDTNPAITRRMETRLLVRDANGYVYGGTYKWRPDNSDADLLPASLSEEVLISTATGTRTQIWSYPSRQDCLSCHSGPAGGVLGLKTRQSNRDFFYATKAVTDNQLRTWNHIGLFDTTLNEGAISNYTRMVAITNTSASLEFRVRSYLDANCSHCHRPGGVRAAWDARIETPLAEQGIIDGFVQGTFGIPDARIVAPGDLAKSIMHLRVGSAAAGVRMPPLAKNVVDRDAWAVLGQWISGFPAPQTLIAQGSDWKYLDDGSNQGTAWRARTFDDGDWASGPAQLGYGDDDEATTVNGEYGNGSRIITTYFRHAFQVTNVAAYANLTLRVLRDDAVAVYLNGSELLRDNLPQGSFNYTTTATDFVDGDGESTLFISKEVSAAGLVEGTNVIAAEIHQYSSSSQDISFDLELIGHRTPIESPRELRAEIIPGPKVHLSFESVLGGSYVIEASTNLQSWAPISTNVPPAGTVHFVTPTASPAQRFFRVRRAN
jgi:uncharacterized repeat protein (TIGR03806 family)